MPIQPGSQLLHYRIVDKLGEGGMGVVWEAEDTRLGRRVAIKVLPQQFAADPERLARFEREAKLLASLNHPNIGSIYGIEQVEGLQCLVLELVPGETLQERISRGPLPADEALEVCVQIAEALTAAHDAGVLHRDLKPANIKVTPDGKVKVLDLGLAKATDSGDSGVDAALSPTMTAATAAGMILGTAAYMSPEQARGKPVDRRTDVWAFGCVLYECLTGRPAFPGSNVSEILAEVLKEEPDWSALPVSTSPAVRRVLRRCLVKDPRKRLRDLGDIRLELVEEASSEAEPERGIAAAAAAPRKSTATALAGWVLAAALLVLTVAQFATRRAAPETVNTPTGPSIHAQLELPEEAQLGFGLASLGVDSNLLALSPDGSLLVYVGRSPGGGSRLYRHDLTEFDAPQPIAGTEGAYLAFFSPDGKSVGFLTQDKLKRVSPNGDALLTICPVNTVIRAQWTADDVIYVGSNQGSKIERVSALGGEVETVHALQAMIFLELLPDGRSALVMTGEDVISTDYADIALLDLETAQIRTVLENGYNAQFVPPDRLVFARAGSLLSVPFDAAKGEVLGEPVTVLREVVMDSVIGQAQFAFSPAGTLAFVSGPELARGGIARIDRDGGEQFLPVEELPYGVLDLGPDDRRLAVHVADVENYVWVYDIPSGRGSRLPGKRTGWPVWSSSGGAIGYSVEGRNTLRVESFDDATAAREAMAFGQDARLYSWSPDDRVLAISGATDGSSRLGFFDLTVDDGETIEWVDSPGSSDWGPSFSPDGRWVAFSSNRTGAFEIWVRSYPEGAVERQISDGGGIEASWCPCGEIFYRRGDRWMSVEVSTDGAELSWGAPELAFETDFVDTLGRSYDVSSDGRQLYVIKQRTPPDGSRINVIANWRE